MSLINCNMKYTNINYFQDDHLAIITLNRPDKFNSFTRHMALEVQNALKEASANENVRCIMLTGNGRAFCAGQDLNEATAMDGPSLETILSEHYNPIIRLLRNIKKPCIAAVNGVAAGAGANIAFACDIVLAASSAKFIQAFSKIGLIPDSGGTFTLPRLIGWHRASALMITGEPISANEAQNMGIVFKIFDDENFLVLATAMAKQISEMPTFGLALTKEALNASFSNSLEQQLQLECELQIKAGQSHDYKEGTTAFLEKRSPKFLGR